MNKTQLYMVIKNEYAEKKARKEATAFGNLQNALKDEKFSELFKTERTLIFDIAKQKSTKQETVNLEQKLAQIVAKKQQRLIELGILESDLTPRYDCKFCNDTGIVRGKMCKCFEKRLKEKTIEESSSCLQKLHSFSEYNTCIAKNKQHQEQLEKLKKIMVSWIDEKVLPEIDLVCLSGKTGVGKTFLTECTATYALKKGKLVSLLSAFSMNNLFLKYHTSKTEDKVSVLDSLLAPDLLIIDDLGTEPVLKNVTLEYLYVLLTERLSQNKKTIITTNLGINQILERYNERIFSRIYNKRQSKIFEIVGDDLRLCK